MDVEINDTWKTVLKDEFEKPYFKEIVHFLKTEKQAGKIIYPPGPLIFNAFNQTTFDNLKVVILGQDPYHGKGQAHGLSFSVQPGIKPPPSLVNIFKELKTDIGIDMPENYGDLTAWAQQGVLLLNAALTVRDGEPFSHAKFGWAQFTDAVIEKISDEKEHIIFILWGKFAQDKKLLIDEGKHFIYNQPTPLLFRLTKDFWDANIFSKTNDILVKIKQQPIDWNLKPYLHDAI